MATLTSVLGDGPPDASLLKRIQAEKKAKSSDKKDWVKITSLVVIILAALVTLFSLACLKGVFPPALLGGSTNVKFILLGALSVAAVSGGIFFVKWRRDS